MPPTHIDPYRDMVIDVLGFGFKNGNEIPEEVEEVLHPQAKKIYDMLTDAEKSLYEGCKLTVLEMSSRILNLKCDITWLIDMLMGLLL